MALDLDVTADVDFITVLTVTEGAGTVREMLAVAGVLGDIDPGIDIVYRDPNHPVPADQWDCLRVNAGEIWHVRRCIEQEVVPLTLEDEAGACAFFDVPGLYLAGS